METTRVNHEDYSQPGATVLMAMELSAKLWRVLFCVLGSTRRRCVTVAVGDFRTLAQHIAAARQKFGLPADAQVVSCYEAGRDGHWIHRWLCSIGVCNHVLDSASIEVTQRAKRVKTDRVDLDKLMSLLQRAQAGEPGVWHEVRVPTVQQEDERQARRDRERLCRESTALKNRMRSLLATQGVQWPEGAELQHLEQLRRWDGQPLPPHLLGSLRDMQERRKLAREQLHRLESQHLAQLREDRCDHVQCMRDLMKLRGLGLQTPWVLATEVFWRDIANRRQLGALAGLTPTPFASGDSQREQGISGAGNRRVRTVMVELAWTWLRLQPHSDLSQWYQRRFGTSGKRNRRIGIVALARKLLVALWRYVQSGELPAGARLKTA